VIALEDNFVHLNDNFINIFKKIVPTGKGELKLIKVDANDESQQSHPS